VIIFDIVGCEMSVKMYLVFKLNVCVITFLYSVTGQRWLDENLLWDKENYGNVETIRIPANKIWTPDLVISNLYVYLFNLFVSWLLHCLIRRKVQNWKSHHKTGFYKCFIVAEAAATNLCLPISTSFWLINTSCKSTFYNIRQKYQRISLRHHSTDRQFLPCMQLHVADEVAQKVELSIHW